METSAPNPQIVKVPSRSQPGQFHEVDLEKPWCDCLAFAFRGRCRHLLLAWKLLRDGQGPEPPREVT